MSNRRHIHKAVKEQLVFMAACMKPRTIAHVTGVRQCTVNRVICLKRLTGLVTFVYAPPKVNKIILWSVARSGLSIRR